MVTDQSKLANPRLHDCGGTCRICTAEDPDAEMKAIVMELVYGKNDDE